ncbi:MAG TPA: VTT domain-containing protein [Candidatus Nanoarchaeia archaeon]|nr:VTT domain-containing protein [Candidatus Nanoarchaeia archaeon]
MQSESFIYETSNNRLQRYIAVSMLAFVIIAGIMIAVFNIRLAQEYPLATPWYSRYVPDLVHDITPLKLFIFCVLSTMIFFQIPAELAFYFGINEGNPMVFFIFVAVAGSMVGHAISYLVGLKLSNQIRYLLSAKTFFSMRRKVNRWGAYAVLLLNVLPATPSDVLTVGLGTVRYDKKRLFSFIAIGNITKFTVIALAVYSLKELF